MGEMESSVPGPNKRVFAFLFDIVLLNTIQLVPIAFLQSYFVTAAYIILKDVFSRSPGKLLTGLQIHDLEQQKASLSARIVRNILLPIPVFPLVEYIALRLSPEGRRLGDRLAGTRVVDVSHNLSEGTYMLLSFGLIIIITVFLFVTGQFSPEKLRSG